MNSDNFDLQGITSLLSEKLINWYEMAIKSIPNLVAALTAFVIFILIAKSVKKVSSRFLPRLTRNKAVTDLLRTIVYISILLVGAFISLEILNLEKTVTSILAGAGVIGLALGFAFQEIAANFVSGILIAFREPYKIGDIVEMKDFLGKVTNINLRTTSITNFQGLEVIVPNKYMFTEPFINYTTTPERRLDLEVGVSYGDDLRAVTDITKSALEKIEERIEDKDVEVYFKEFGGSSINLSARVWIKYPENQAYLKARHNAVINIKEAFDENDITIPFPIRTLDYDPKGGKELKNVLPISEEASQNLEQ